MPRASQPEDTGFSVERLLAFGDGAPSLEEKLAFAHVFRAGTRDGHKQIDRLLLEEIGRMRSGLEEAQAAQHELQELLRRLASPPWQPALLLRTVDTPLGPRAMVLHGSARRVVALGNEVDLADLVVGEEVFLDSGGDIIVRRSPYGLPPFGETATFERATSDGRCVLTWRDEEVVVDSAGSLDVSTLNPGDRLLWDRAAWMAFERLEEGRRREFVLTEVPDARRGDIGGQDAALEFVLSALTATLVAPAKALAYGLKGRRTILMVGPPGCGKTSIARVAVAEMARLSGRPCRFGVVKAAGWESSWVGQTQQRISAIFALLRQAASDGYAVLFLDEIEAVGRTRGRAGSEHGDKFLATLLAELDGFDARANVAVLAATNRADLLDSALTSRFDLQVMVGRPNLEGARRIFDIHLPRAIPIRGDDEDQVAARDALIDTAVSRLYSPNADNALCTLTFRDGATRTVTARELASGRLFAQICETACQRAYLRDVRSGEGGLTVADVEHAVDEAIARLSTTLTRQNLHDHLADLPQDRDVVGVAPVARRVPRSYRYRHAA